MDETNAKLQTALACLFSELCYDFFGQLLLISELVWLFVTITESYEVKRRQSRLFPITHKNYCFCHVWILLLALEIVFDMVESRFCHSKKSCMPARLIKWLHTCFQLLRAYRRKEVEVCTSRLIHIDTHPHCDISSVSNRACKSNDSCLQIALIALHTSGPRNDYLVFWWEQMKLIKYTQGYLVLEITATPDSFVSPLARYCFPCAWCCKNDISLLIHYHCLYFLYRLAWSNHHNSETKFFAS